MNKNLSFICFFAFIFVSFIMYKNRHSTYEISPAEKTVNYLFEKNARFLSKKYDMRPIGTNVAMPRGNVKLLGLHFQIRGPLQKNELRKILINSAKDFISIVNDNTEIHKYLEHDPFGIQALDITLFVIDSQGMGVDYPDIGVASFRGGNLHYKMIAGIDVEKTITREEETYEEALKKIQTQ